MGNIMEVNENTKDMALAIALGMIIYEKARKSIPLEVTPTKEQVIAQADIFWNEIETGADIGAKTNDPDDGMADSTVEVDRPAPKVFSAFEFNSLENFRNNLDRLRLLVNGQNESMSGLSASGISYLEGLKKAYHIMSDSTN